jgi:plastocyanin
MATTNISLGASGPSPSSVPANHGDKITWTNPQSVSVTLTLPTCLSPSNNTTITISGNTTYVTTYTVNSGTNGSYPYTYHANPTQAEQTGTIDVS